MARNQESGIRVWMPHDKRHEVRLLDRRPFRKPRKKGKKKDGRWHSRSGRACAGRREKSPQFDLRAPITAERAAVPLVSDI